MCKFTLVIVFLTIISSVIAGWVNQIEQCLNGVEIHLDDYKKLLNNLEKNHTDFSISEDISKLISHAAESIKQTSPQTKWIISSLIETLQQLITKIPDPTQIKPGAVVPGTVIIQKPPHHHHHDVIQVYPENQPSRFPRPQRPYPPSQPYPYPIYPEPNPEHRPQPLPEHRPEPYPPTHPEHRPEPYPPTYPEHRPEPYPQTYPEHRPEPYPQTYPEHRPEPYPQIFPHENRPLVSPVHEPEPYPEVYPDEDDDDEYGKVVASLLKDMAEVYKPLIDVTDKFSNILNYALLKRK